MASSLRNRAFPAGEGEGEEEDGSRGTVVSGLNVEELADEDDRTEPKSVLLVVFLQLFLIA